MGVSPIGAELRERRRLAFSTVPVSIHDANMAPLARGSRSRVPPFGGAKLTPPAAAFFAVSGLADGENSSCHRRKCAPISMEAFCTLPVHTMRGPKLGRVTSLGHRSTTGPYSATVRHMAPAKPPHWTEIASREGKAIAAGEMSRVWPIAKPSRRCAPTWATSGRARSRSNCWRWRTIGPARPSWLRSSTRSSMPDD
jgi:hypothetical protein